MSDTPENTIKKLHQYFKHTMTTLPIISPNIEIRETTGKGLGLFATALVPKGTYLIQEEALLKGVNPAQYKHKQEFISAIETQVFSTLSDDNRSAFLGLSREEHLVNAFLGSSVTASEEDDEDQDEAFTTSRKYLSALACAAYHTNAFGCGVYANIARINHSCSPNCEMKGDDQQGMVFAVRDVKTGEKITLSYVSGLVGDCVQGDGKLRHLLHYGFMWYCESCVWPNRVVSEKRRVRMRRLGGDLGFLLGRLRGQGDTLMVHGPLAVSVAITERFGFSAAHKAMVELNVLADQEGLYLYEVFRLYTTCQALARVFNEMNPTMRNVNFCVWWSRQMKRFTAEFWTWAPDAGR